MIIMLSQCAFSCAAPAPSYKHQAWKGWVIGSYNYAWLPTDTGQWCNHPVLLVDIREQRAGEIRFVVARLYNKATATGLFLALGPLARWKSYISLLSWPQDVEYVISNHFDILFGWELRTWTRRVSPSLSTHWAIDVDNKRLTKCTPSPESDIGLALNYMCTKFGFLRLPRELRDMVYYLAWFDEQQESGHSLIYTHSLLCKQYCDERGWPWYRDLSMPTLGPLPRLQTPGIGRVCSQVREEALEVLYRTKMLVITVTSTDSFRGLEQDWLPKIERFEHLRVELILPCLRDQTVRDCFSAALRVLKERAVSVRRLEIRLGICHLNAFTAARHQRFANDDHRSSTAVQESSSAVYNSSNSLRDGRRMPLQMPTTLSCLGLVGCMRELSLLLFEKAPVGNPLHLAWGISDAQKLDGDFRCACTYLRADFLSDLWDCRNYMGRSEEADYVNILWHGESCEQLGRKLHRAMQA